nr:MAG TPA: hypothetical protein [Caudoviricetes sp.]
MNIFDFKREKRTIILTFSERKNKTNPFARLAYYFL